MTILHRYIARVVIISILLVMAMVLGLGFFIDLLTEFQDIGVGDYGFSEAFIHALLRLPATLYQFFPMVALLGGVLALGLLMQHQELTMMRASGVPLKRIIEGVLLGALLLILLMTIVGEMISPPANFLADKRKDSAQSGGQAVATASGVWIHEKDNFYHINQVIGKKQLEGVTRYEFNGDHQLIASYYIASMKYDNHHWILNQSVKTTFKKNEIKSESIPSMVWDVSLNPNLLTVGMISPEEMTLKNLLNYSEHLVSSGLQATEYQFSFWKRLFQPLATIVMILLAVPFVLTSSRQTIIGRRIFLGTLVGFVFYILNAFLGQLSIVLQWSPWIAALFPIFLFAVIGYSVAICLL